jgi:hypothetical protein
MGLLGLWSRDVVGVGGGEFDYMPGVVEVD